MLSRRLAQGATLVVDDKLAAVQLEAYVASTGNLLEARAWRSPDIQTHDDLCASVWAADFGRDRLLLTSVQSDALWRRIVAESPSGAALIDTTRIATWAKQAWGLLQAWQLDFRELRARDDDPGFGNFLSWAARFEETLTHWGWVDKATLTRLVAQQHRPNGHDPDHVVWADLRDATPVIRTHSRTLAQAGCETSTWVPESVRRCVYRVGLEHARDELHQAVRWAQRKIDDAPNARVALVVAIDVETELGLARYFDETAHESSLRYRLADGVSVEREPAIGAALDCLGLFSRRADFPVFSRWLRSPFVGDDVESLGVRCLAEADLRGELVAQLGFMTAYRTAGLERRLGQRVPKLCAAVDRVLGRLEDTTGVQSPTRWAGVAQELLKELGWPGTETPVPGSVVDAWQRVLEEFSGLTPVLGSIDYETALTELRAGVSRARIPNRFLLEGVTVLSRLEDVGPGYDAAWVVGMSDRFWPRPAEPNPLLPHALQAAHEMPFATPGDAVQRCRTLTDRLIARVPETVFSYPLMENEFAAEASPLLSEIAEMDAALPPTLATVYAPNTAEAQTEDLDDPVPPFSGVAISGGAGTLATQAQCPLRAFIDSRLSVRPLERPDRGIGARQRGILVHRALELLYAALPGSQQLAAQSDDQLATRIRECIDRAIGERIRGASGSLRVYAALERDRLIPLLSELVRLDLARSEFVTDSLETKLTARIGGVDVGCRIDRIDMLADGSLAIIDYKTGSAATPAGWFKPRLVEPQLPLYLQVVDADVEAVVIGRVHTQSVVYRGIWQRPETFPGSAYRPRAPLAWVDQKARWRDQLEELVAEYVGGDGRIFLSGLAYAEGFYAPLTRVYEQVWYLGESSNGAGE